MAIAALELAKKLKSAFSRHECQTVPDVGLSGQTNGALLAQAESASFDLFLTTDKGIRYQFNLAGGGSLF